MKSRAVAIAAFVSLLSLSAPVTPGEAGCGCQKPPPPLAAIRPAFASPGNTVTLFAPTMEENGRYRVTFSHPANEEGSIRTTGRQLFTSE